eukprot:m.66673 g.66673  ORF g.66673 m.66673 type:complete len:89 (-) comp23713_c0_seq1:160-426(-)
MFTTGALSRWKNLKFFSSKNESRVALFVVHLFGDEKQPKLLFCLLVFRDECHFHEGTACGDSKSIFFFWANRIRVQSNGINLGTPIFY